MKISKMEQFIESYLDFNNLIFTKMNDEDTKIIYDLFKNDIIDLTKDYNDIVYNYIGIYYKIRRDFPNMIKYHLKAISKGNSNSMVDLGNHYERQKDFANMKKYYLMGMDSGNLFAFRD